MNFFSWFIAEKSPKSDGRKLSDSILSLQNILNEKEKFLRTKLLAPIVWDFDSLENQVIEHKVSFLIFYFLFYEVFLIIFPLLFTVCLSYNYFLCI